MMNTNKRDRDFIKITPIMAYGREDAKNIAIILRCNNTQEKLQAIKCVYGLGINDECKLFVIQKLLSLPKSDRFGIAKEIDKRLEKEDINENDN